MVKLASRFAPLVLGLVWSSAVLAAPDAGTPAAPAPAAKPTPAATPAAPAAKPAPAATPATPAAAAKPAPAATPAAPAPVAKPAPAATPAKPAVAPVAKPAPAATPVKPVAPVHTATPVSAAALVGGVVVLERANRTLGLGTVLNGDGRILTALSTIGDGRNVNARYADGTVLPVRLGHADRVRDLGLLVPQSSRQRHGLRASRKATAEGTAPLKSFVVAGNKAAPGASVAPGTPGTFQGGDGKPLSDALTFAAPLAATSAGSPLIDEAGEVIAVVTSACRRVQTGCAPTLVGTPVSAVRDFLQKAPLSAAIPTAWIGVDGIADDTGTSRGVRLQTVRGPAATAGLRAGKDAKSADVIVAIDSQPITTPDALADAVQAHAIGDAIDVLVLGAGRFRHVTLVVVAAPR